MSRAKICIVALVLGLCNVCVIANKFQAPILLLCGPRVFEQLDVLACKIHKVGLLAKLQNKPLQFILVGPISVVSHVQNEWFFTRKGAHLL